MVEDERLVHVCGGRDRPGRNPGDAFRAERLHCAVEQLKPATPFPSGECVVAGPDATRGANAAPAITAVTVNAASPAHPALDSGAPEKANFATGAGIADAAPPTILDLTRSQRMFGPDRTSAMLATVPTTAPAVAPGIAASGP